MYQNGAMLAAFLLIYSAVAGRIERSLISGPIVFTAAGFILGSAVASATPPAFLFSLVALLSRSGCYFQVRKKPTSPGMPPGYSRISALSSKPSGRKCSRQNS